MAEVVVIGYPTEAQAREIIAVLRGLERDLAIQTLGTAVVVRDEDGELRMAMPTHAISAGAASGGLWALVTGLLSALMSGGIRHELRKQTRSLLEPGSAAVALLFQKASPDRTIEALAPYGGTVLKATLSHEAELNVQEALAQMSLTAGPA